MLKLDEITVLIATRNRIEELKITLQKSVFLLNNENVNFIICDDASTDETYQYVKSQYPEIKLLHNKRQKGIHYCRNLMYSHVKTKYAITIDDDINFVNEFNIENITNYFENNPECAVMAFRIFWGENLPVSLDSNEVSEQVKSFGAGGHAINIAHLNSIPKLPEWFVFYGEEDFMAIQLFKRKKEVHYIPDLFVHHRVDLRKRKKQSDYYKRLHLSLRSGWYIYMLFYPKNVILRKISYSIYSKIRFMVLKGNLRVLFILLLGIKDVFLNYRKLVASSNRLTKEEYTNYSRLPMAKLYWKPE